MTMIRVSTLLALALAALTLTPAAQAQWQPVGPALPSGGGQTVQMREPGRRLPRMPHAVCQHAGIGQPVVVVGLR
ncbi:MAG: hypothetical protein V9G22_17155 [Ottowia sp.]